MTSDAFEAAVASAYDPSETLYVVAFADSPSDPSRYLLLQRTSQPEEQDVTLGQNTYHVEWCGQERSTYGGIEAFFLGTSSAQVVFTPQAAAALGDLEELSVTFMLSAEEYEALRQALEGIFAGTGRLAVAGA
ncbi:hypothetical protein PSMEN_07180 [Ectopseudomonas mendocina]|nr:hypothetical protein PSMEN_07180 [Pseudomonas mendocina]